LVVFVFWHCYVFDCCIFFCLIYDFVDAVCERHTSLLVCECFRRSDDYVRHVYYLLMNRLEKHHAEIRLSAFQIAAELFVRSHCFRDLLLSDCQRFLELVLGKFCFTVIFLVLQCYCLY